MNTDEMREILKSEIMPLSPEDMDALKLEAHDFSAFAESDAHKFSFILKRLSRYGVLKNHSESIVSDLVRHHQYMRTICDAMVQCSVYWDNYFLEPEDEKRLVSSYFSSRNMSEVWSTLIQNPGCSIALVKAYAILLNNTVFEAENKQKILSALVLCSDSAQIDRFVFALITYKEARIPLVGVHMEALFKCPQQADFLRDPIIWMIQSEFSPEVKEKYLSIILLIPKYSSHFFNYMTQYAIHEIEVVSAVEVELSKQVDFLAEYSEVGDMYLRNMMVCSDRIYYLKLRGGAEEALGLDKIRETLLSVIKAHPKQSESLLDLFLTADRLRWIKVSDRGEYLAVLVRYIKNMDAYSKLLRSVFDLSVRHPGDVEQSRKNFFLCFKFLPYANEIMSQLPKGYTLPNLYRVMSAIEKRKDMTLSAIAAKLGSGVIVPKDFPTELKVEIASYLAQPGQESQSFFPRKMKRKLARSNKESIDKMADIIDHIEIYRKPRK